MRIEEKRTPKRIKVHLPVTYTILGERKAIVYEGTTYDISDSGICFYTDMPLQVGVTLKIQIFQILDVPRTCIVRWNSMKSPKCWKVGVSFL
jgi:hypothetical protein